MNVVINLNLEYWSNSCGESYEIDHMKSETELHMNSAYG